MAKTKIEFFLLCQKESSFAKSFVDHEFVLALTIFIVADHYRTDIEEVFYMAKDIDYNDVPIMSQSFKRICDENNLNISFLNPEIHLA